MTTPSAADPDLWCMSHGCPDALPTHTEGDGCLLRVMRTDEHARIAAMVSHLPCEIRVDGAEVWAVAPEVSAESPRSASARQLSGLELQLAQEILRLRRMLFGEMAL